ncbi:MAG: hypothetical protein ABSA08_04520 [Acidimicrobiales bacterium]
MVDGDLVDNFEHRHRRAEAGEIGADPPEDVDHLDLGHDVEISAPPAHHVDVRERFETRPDVALHLANALGDGAHLAVLGRDDRHDPVRLAEPDRPEDDPGVAVRRHGS